MENNGENLIKLFSLVGDTMELINNKMSTELEDDMSEQQLALLEEARKATSSSELKKMADKLGSINEKMKNYAT